jgi:two-component system, cell cycle response regulator
MNESQPPEPRTAEITLPPDPARPGSAARQGTVMVLAGTQMGAAFALTAHATLIGRNPRAHVALDDHGVSRNHARVLHRDGQYEIQDMGSTNGTFVNGERVEQGVLLRDGARIQMGNAVLRFALQDEMEWEATKRLYEASVQDALTGVFNRRYFEQRLIGEFAFAARHGTALCVLLADVDHFKRINDRFGHPAGDMVLRRVGAELRAAVRAEDLVARYGGEEFVVLARGIDPSGARAFAERIRGLLERARIEWEGTRIAVTASIGLAHNHTGAAVTDPQRLVADADKALYAAKASGRNRVQSAQSPGRYQVTRGEEPPANPPPPPRRQQAGTTAARGPKEQRVELPLDRMRRSAKTTKLE